MYVPPCFPAGGCCGISKPSCAPTRKPDEQKGGKRSTCDSVRGVLKYFLMDARHQLQAHKSSHHRDWILCPFPAVPLLLS